ncbi:uncharacterized protein [Paramisgurnus dabryanus]
MRSSWKWCLSFGTTHLASLKIVTMACTKNIGLRVLFGKDDAHKMFLPNGLPASLDDMLEKVKMTFNLRGNIRLQYLDADFGEFVNVTDISEIQHLGTIKVIQLQDEMFPVQELGSSATSGLTMEMDDVTSEISCNTECSTESPNISHPESVLSRTHPWPTNFPIPCFSYETELQLERGNAEYQANKKVLTVGSKMKSDILQKVAEQIYKFKAYPLDTDFSEVAEALVERHPCLKEPGSCCGSYGWKQRLKFKMANYRTMLKLHGCAEININSLKAKGNEDAHPSKNIKRPRRAEANYCPSLPVGETRESLEKLRITLLNEAKKKNNDKVIREIMAKTFAYRRYEIVTEQPNIADFMNRWPTLFQENEINAEFLRITTVPLQIRFFAELDRLSTNLVKVIKGRGGAIRSKTSQYVLAFDETSDINIRRECILRSIILYLGEDDKNLIKDYMDIQDEQESDDLSKQTMAIFVKRKP